MKCTASTHSRFLSLLAATCSALFVLVSPAHAGFTDTAPQGVFVVDGGVMLSKIGGHWHDDGTMGPLLDPVELYEPGGGLQGLLLADVDARYNVLVTMIMYGVTDSISAFVGIPLVLETSVDPHLSWVPGDYSPTLGRPFSEDDFWEWAGSMGQPKPGYWEGNFNTLSDIVLGLRWRFSDLMEMPDGLRLSLTIFGALPTGTSADPEEIVSAGTKSWNLHSQGDLGFHVSADYNFENFIDGRLTLGLDIFYEVFLPMTEYSSTGAVNPLLLNERPYVGETYRMNPGDFAGFEIAAEIVAIKGPSPETWLTRRSPEMAASQPPLLKLSFSYGFTGVAQSRWYSDSAIWNWEQEQFWGPGYKNILSARADLSLLRLGVPLDLTVGLRDLTLLPGKNVRAPTIFSFGVRVPLKFW